MNQILVTNNGFNKNDKNNGSKIDESVGILPYIFMVLGLTTWFLSLIFFIVYNVIPAGKEISNYKDKV